MIAIIFLFCNESCELFKFEIFSPIIAILKQSHSRDFVTLNLIIQNSAHTITLTLSFHKQGLKSQINNYPNVT